MNLDEPVLLLEWGCHNLLMGCVSDCFECMRTVPTRKKEGKNEEGRTDFCHHAAPSDNVGVNLLSRLLFVRHDSLEQTIKVFVLGVIQLVKRLETLRQVGAQPGRVIILDGRIVQTKVVIRII